MRINHNISAQLANVNLKKTDSKISNSLERLSSGYKINKAADDSAGLALSNKMRTQIRALDQSSRNASDGESIIETAEGALSEIEAVLQRIRELSVQAANDTYCLDDRKSIQAEVEQMLDEIDRIASTTEFNGKPLLDGAASRTMVSNNDTVNAISASMEIKAGDYVFSVEEVGTAATAVFEYSIPDSKDGNYKIDINGVEMDILYTDTDDTIQERLISICDAMNIEVDGEGSGMTMTTRAPGAKQSIIIEYPGQEKEVYTGTDATISLNDGFAETASYVSNGNNITITDNDGFKMQVEVSAESSGSVTLSVYDAGYMTIQIGANEHQNLDIDFPDISCNTLQLRSMDGENLINCCTQLGASNAITAMDQAITKVSAARSSLGAFENRLDSTISSLDISSENMTDSMSRIMDTDMADEMTNYTQFDVLSQAATSMLAQANNRPQQVMSLLQS